MYISKIRFTAAAGFKLNQKQNTQNKSYVRKKVALSVKNKNTKNGGKKQAKKEPLR